MLSLHVEYFLQLAIYFVILIIIIQNLTSQSKKLKESKKLNTIRLWDAHWLVKLILSGPDIVNGERESILQRIYQKFMSPAAIYSYKSKIFSIFGIQFLFAYEYDSLRQIIQSDWCSDRSPEGLLEIFTHGKPRGILLNNGEDWKEIKRYTVKQLSKLGFGKNDKMTSILTEELPDLLNRIESLKKLSGNQIQVNGLFSLAIINVIWCIAGGTKFKENDPDFIKLYNATTEITSIHFFYLRFLYTFKDIKGIRNIFGYSRMKRCSDVIHELFTKFINERKSLGLYKTNPECFVDHFLKELDNKEQNGTTDDVYCTEQLIGIIKDLFMAGIDTSSNYLECVMMYMAKYPEVQTKIQEEIDSVIGKGSIPQYSEHRRCVPYTFATMMEIHRMANVVAFSPRSTRVEHTLDGVRIKKGTFAAMTYFPQRMDEKYWDDPKAFRPERFLDNNNNIVQEKINRLMIFGLGPRACPGESVANSSTFAMFLSILQKYRITKAIDSEILAMKETFGFTNGPEPFHISVFER